ncbi:MAG: LysR family transcriptional regulator [Rectinemataceae bacterium]
MCGYTRSELRHLRYFLAVAEELNFRRAAEMLYITQPPLTRQVQELEQELGVTLFDRLGKKIKLTSAGEFLRREARLLLDRADEIKRLVKATEEGEQSRLRLGFIESALHSFLPGVLSDLRERKPEISFELFEMTTEEQVDALLHDRLDAGFIRNWGQVEELEYTKIIDETFVAIYSRKLSKSNDASSLEELARLPFISFSRAKAPGLVGRIDEIFAINNLRPRHIFDGGGLETILKILFMGLGWAILPWYTVSHATEVKELVHFEIPNMKKKTEIGVAWPKGKTSMAVKSLLDSMQDLKS